MVNRPDRHGMEPEDMRQVFINAGKPAPARGWPQVPTRTAVLLGLLALAILLGLVAGALGAGTGAGETVKKGRGGPGALQITPLEKSKIIPPLAAPTIYNFLQNFPNLAAPLQPRAPAVAHEPPILNKPIDLVLALTLVLTVLLWINLRLGRRP